MRSPALRAGALLATLCCVSVSGCSDSVTSDLGGRQASGGASPSLLGGLLATVLQRLVPLGHDYSASATIGTAGGTISIPQAGFSITFPAGAVSAPTRVTATALAGSNVAYEFEPHGIVFNREPTISQDLSLTAVVTRLLSLGPQLEGGYFANEADLGSGTAVITETRPATFDLLRLRTTFTIRHFSGYAVTQKRSGGYFGSSNDRSAETTLQR